MRGRTLLLAALLTLAAAPHAQAADFVGLGDSYSSGTGTADSYADNCQRTSLVYPVLLQPQLGTGPNHSCSGARTQHVTTQAQAPGNPAPQVNLAGLGADTDYVTLQIGGNDAGFVDVLVSCANPFDDCNAAINEARQRAQTELPPKLAATYTAVRAKVPNAVIAVVGYPRIFRPNQSCNVFYSASEVNAFNAAADELNEMIREVAQAHALAFVDPRPIFIGHGACDAEEWINGLSWGGSNVVHPNSYHPKAVGHSSGFRPVTLSTIQGLPQTTIGQAPANPSNNPNPQFSFASSVGGSSFQCRLDAGAYAPCSSPRQLSGLGEGSHTLSVRAINPAGNADQSPASHTWTVDTTAPPLSLSPQGVGGTVASDSETFTFSSTDPQASFECRLDDGLFDPCESPHELTELPDGPREFSVRAVDPAGNASTSSRTWTVDTTAPVTAVNLGPSDPTPSGDARFEFAADDPAALLECSLDGADFEECSSPQEFSGLEEGQHSFLVRATDAVGNVGPADAHHWRIDFTAAVVEITSGPPALTNQTSVTFGFESDDSEATMDCGLEGQPLAPCDSPTGHTLSGLGDGEHTFMVRATDAASHEATASRTFTVDTVAPGAAIASGPPALTRSTDAEIAFASNDPTASLQCRFDSAPGFEPCESPFTAQDLGDGPHELRVRAVDPAGNESALATHSWTVDTTAPVAAIGAAPPPVTSARTASFGFTANEAGSSFECRLDTAEEAGFEPCTSPHVIDDLGHGQHTLEVRAIDPAGNQQAVPTAHTWSVDAVAPTVAISSHPDDPTRTGSAAFAFAADEAGSTFECRLTRIEDGGPPPGWISGCSSPRAYPTLADGSYVFEVRATDPLGNVGEPTVFAWLIDRSTPNLTVVQKPPAHAASSSATFSFASNEEQVYFECRLDPVPSAPWELCDSPQELSGLSEGSHRFEVRVTDTAGNASTVAAHDWTVDTVAPAISLDPASGPNGSVKETSASFAFTATGATQIRCGLDGGAPEPCSSPRAYTGLADAVHSFEVTAVDAAGNAASAGRTWTVDTVAPRTTILTGPPASTALTSASFTFASNEAGAGFECSLDGTLFGPCSSPAAFAGLAFGDHGFRVRARDAAGNLEAAPALHEWRIAAPAQGDVGGEARGKKPKKCKRKRGGKRAPKRCGKPKKKQKKKRS